MAPDIKATLKEAKSAVKENDFEKVSKYSKIVLKHDRNNYQVLIAIANSSGYYFYVTSDMNEYINYSRRLILSCISGLGFVWSCLSRTEEI